MLRAQTVYAVGGYAIPDFASPDPIGSSTPNSGVFTTLVATGRIAAGWTQVEAYESAYGAAGNKSIFACSNTAGEASQALAQFNDAATASSVNFVKGRGTVSSGTIVQSGDSLGGIYWYGAASSSAIALAASISAVVDGTPGAASDMPGRLVFSVTPDGSGTAVEAMRISNDKSATFAAGVTATSLTVAPTSGTISYAANWAASSGSVVKKCNDLVVLNFACVGAGSGSTTVATLPAGYRPITASLICVGRLYYVDTTSYSMVQVTIATTGTITIDFTIPSTAAGDLLKLNVSFYVV